MSLLPIKLLVPLLVLSSSLNAALLGAPGGEPSYKDFAKMARFLVHRLDWTSMATISSNPAILGYPMAGVISYADSALGEESTGQVYMLLTDLDIPEKDLKKDNKLTLLFTMAQYKNCTDPMEPTCARLMMTGRMERIAKDSDDYEFGLNAVLSRHPVAAAWDFQHNFYLAKIDVQYLMLQDFYGRPNVVPVEEYWAADPSNYVQPRSYRRIGRRRFYPRPLPGATPY